MGTSFIMFGSFFKMLWVDYMVVGNWVRIYFGQWMTISKEKGSTLWLAIATFKTDDDLFQMDTHLPGTPNNRFLMDGNGDFQPFPM